ncbi:hypothetical protein GQX73_g1113 [Xylaria multiplex]|uniref:C2H2-type domain-containing protein n=1 Tax=Xylaria multiplex TaxID=323545 RepID=A0A7C8IWE0_9PEZI|nr:hypothetical protein GQX73_g1113 [Xylaria multiplex]
MGGKKRKHPDVEELLNRPWCYYCERDFEDLKLLISHQKAKHFKCDRCGRRLNTAGGLSVHMNQVHKESLSSVENALPNRQGLDVEIFGMEGIPEDIVQQHNQRIIQNFYQAQAERYAATGNPPPGQSDKRPAKKIKAETPDEIKKRLAEHRARLAGQKNAGGGNATHTPPQGLPDGHSPGQSASPGAFNSPFHPPGAQYSGYPNQPQYPHAYPPSNLPSRPGSNVPVASGLPPRPGQPGWAANASTAEELGPGAAPQQGDDIDQLIRMAEAGIRPPKKSEAHTATEEASPEKKSKKEKDKNVQMIYEDELSPEERMAMMPRYAFAPEAAAA